MIKPTLSSIILEEYTEQANGQTSVLYCEYNENQNNPLRTPIFIYDDEEKRNQFHLISDKSGDIFGVLFFDNETYEKERDKAVKKEIKRQLSEAKKKKKDTENSKSIPSEKKNQEEKKGLTRIASSDSTDSIRSVELELKKESQSKDNLSDANKKPDIVTTEINLLKEQDQQLLTPLIETIKKNLTSEIDPAKYIKRKALNWREICGLLESVNGEIHREKNQNLSTIREKLIDYLFSKVLYTYYDNLYKSITELQTINRQLIANEGNVDPQDLIEINKKKKTLDQNIKNIIKENHNANIIYNALYSNLNTYKETIEKRPSVSEFILAKYNASKSSNDLFQAIGRKEIASIHEVSVVRKKSLSETTSWFIGKSLFLTNEVTKGLFSAFVNTLFLTIPTGLITILIDKEAGLGLSKQTMTPLGSIAEIQNGLSNAGFWTNGIIMVLSTVAVLLSIIKIIDIIKKKIQLKKYICNFTGIDSHQSTIKHFFVSLFATENEETTIKDTNKSDIAKYEISQKLRAIIKSSSWQEYRLALIGSRSQNIELKNVVKANFDDIKGNKNLERHIKDDLASVWNKKEALEGHIKILLNYNNNPPTQDQDDLKIYKTLKSLKIEGFNSSNTQKLTNLSGDDENKIKTLLIAEKKFGKARSNYLENKEQEDLDDLLKKNKEAYTIFWIIKNRQLSEIAIEKLFSKNPIEPGIYKYLEAREEVSKNDAARRVYLRLSSNELHTEQMIKDELDKEYENDFLFTKYLLGITELSDTGTTLFGSYSFSVWAGTLSAAFSIALQIMKANGIVKTSPEYQVIYYIVQGLSLASSFFAGSRQLDVVFGAGIIKNTIWLPAKANCKKFILDQVKKEDRTLLTYIKYTFLFLYEIIKRSIAQPCGASKNFLKGVVYIVSMGVTLGFKIIAYALGLATVNPFLNAILDFVFTAVSSLLLSGGNAALNFVDWLLDGVFKKTRAKITAGFLASIDKFFISLCVGREAYEKGVAGELKRPHIDCFNKMLALLAAESPNKDLQKMPFDNKNQGKSNNVIQNVKQEEILPTEQDNKTLPRSNSDVDLLVEQSPNRGEDLLSEPLPNNGEIAITPENFLSEFQGNEKLEEEFARSLSNANFKDHQQVDEQPKYQALAKLATLWADMALPCKLLDQKKPGDLVAKHLMSFMKKENIETLKEKKPQIFDHTIKVQTTQNNNTVFARHNQL